MFEQKDIHPDRRVFDNENQEQTIQALYSGMELDYVPSWDRDAEDDAAEEVTPA